MRVIVDSALRPRHVEPWPLWKGILFVAVCACVFWAAVAVVVGG